MEWIDIEATAADALGRSIERIDGCDDPAIVIARPNRSALEAMAAEIDRRPADEVPLRGTTFTIKDNIDLAGTPTTAACPSAAYVPGTSATVVDRLVEAGAMPVAKVNLDQFATGLVGTRSPFGVPRNPFDQGIVPGGSSSGSAVSITAGMATFSIGTDTAGSGRVPAAMCGLASVKPTPGRVSTSGIVPAVRSIDCAAVFTPTLAEAAAVVDAAAGLDRTDLYSRQAVPISSGPVDRLGVLAPDTLAGLGCDPAIQREYAMVVDHLERLGFGLTEIDPGPLFELGDDLYGGPWVVERRIAVDDLAHAEDDLDPTVASILATAYGYSAADVHRARYRRAALTQRIEQMMTDLDALALPTVGWHPTLDQVDAEPLAANARMGRFTTFTNLAGMCAVTFPCDWVEPRDRRPPCSLSLHGRAWADDLLVAAGQRILGHEVAPPVDWIVLAVAGAHLRGQALEHQLTDRGARWITTTHSAPSYRLHAMPSEPPKPAMVYVGPSGASIELDLWTLSPAAFASFAVSIPAPLGIGSVELADGRSVPGFIAEPRAVDGAVDITHHGGWRAYRSSLGS